MLHVLVTDSGVLKLKAYMYMYPSTGPLKVSVSTDGRHKIQHIVLITMCHAQTCVNTTQHAMMACAKANVVSAAPFAFLACVLWCKLKNTGSNTMPWGTAHRLLGASLWKSVYRRQRLRPTRYESQNKAVGCCGVKRGGDKDEYNIRCSTMRDIG